MLSSDLVMASIFLADAKGVQMYLLAKNLLELTPLDPGLILLHSKGRFDLYDYISRLQRQYP
jgi:hypothetical protein